MWLSLVEYLNGVQGAAGSTPVTPTNLKVLQTVRLQDFLFYPKYKKFCAGQLLGQLLSLKLWESEYFMATIYPNFKNGKIISFKFKSYLGKDENGKQIFKCKTWIPDKQMFELKHLLKKTRLLSFDLL